MKVRSDNEMLLDVHRALVPIAIHGKCLDVDRFYLGWRDERWSVGLGRQRYQEFICKIIPKIIEARRDSCVGKIVLVRESSEQAGILLLHSLLSLAELECTMLEPWATKGRLIEQIFRGRPPRNGERVMILCGDAQDGVGISRNAAHLRQRGAFVPAAFALIGNNEAKESLAQEDVELFSYWTHEELAAMLSDLSSAA